ncbi:MAG: DUF4340 domain-containing protein, partial [Acidobacteriota bacterium]|nr:DUF4340 domain-containing protein [Acidobacteriota bacterium]
SDEEFGLATPEYAIELDLEGRSAPFTLTVGSTTGSSTRRYYAVEDSRFTVDSDLPNLLDRPAVEWQSRRWARLESFQTDAAEIALGDLEGRLERSDGEWRWNNEPVSYSAAADFLDTVTDVTGVRIVPRSDVDVEIDRRPILTLALSAAERVENLTIWSNEGGALLAGREGRDYVLEIEREQLELMRAAVMVLQDSSGDEGASEESLPLE